MSTLLHSFCSILVGSWLAILSSDGVKPPITIVSDQSWEVSGRPTEFGEYPLSAEQLVSATAPLPGGTHQAVAAEFYSPSTIIPGTVPIWRSRRAGDDWEAYQFRKTVPLGPEKIRSVRLQVNCDDASRVYINQRLVNPDGRGATFNNARGRHAYFRNLSSYMYDVIRTYDVTDYFFTNVTNTIVVEVANQPIGDNHAYLSAKIVIEFEPTPDPVAPNVANNRPRPSAPAVSAKKQAPVRRPAATTRAVVPQQEAAKAEPAPPTVFEAGRDVAIEKLRVGSVLELGQVYFRADDYKLDSSSYRTLSALATFMQRHPSLKIEVGGHTNLRPNERFAARLSENRARSVMRYLADNGVAADRITVRGYGKSRPRIDTISNEADKANQRVEVTITAR